MANTCCWYETRLPENLIKDILDNLNKIDESVSVSDLKKLTKIYKNILVSYFK